MHYSHVGRVKDLADEAMKKIQEQEASFEEFKSSTGLDLSSRAEEFDLSELDRRVKAIERVLSH